MNDDVILACDSERPEIEEFRLFAVCQSGSSQESRNHTLTEFNVKNWLNSCWRNKKGTVR